MPGRATRPPSRATSAPGTRFDRALARFAESYADQNERDYAALEAAVESGRVTAGARPQPGLTAPGAVDVRQGKRFAAGHRADAVGHAR